MYEKLKKIANTETKQRLIKNYVALSVLQGANFIIPLIILPYLIRTLGAKTFGLVMFAQSFILYFFIIVDFGFSLSGVREVAIHRDNISKLEEIFNVIMMIKLILVVLCFFIMLGIVFEFKQFASDYKLYILTYGWVVGQAMFPIWFFQGIEKMKYITIFKIIAQLMSLLAIIMFVKKPNDYLLVPIFNSFGFVLVGIISMVIITREFQFKFHVPKFKVLKNYFVESSHFFLSRAAVSAYTSSNTFVLGLFTNNTMVGYYSIAQKLYIALQALYMPIVTVLYPYIAKEKNVRFFKKIFNMAVVFNVIAVVVLYFMAPYLVKVVSGSLIIESMQVFRIFLLVALLVVPSILIGYPFLAALGYKKYANYSVIVAAIFHLTGLGTLAYFHLVSIYTVIFLLVLTESIVLIIRIYGINRYHLWRKS